METPSSMRQAPRSAVAQKGKQEGSLSRSRTKGKPDRSALLDITNDSPIVGLASGCSLTPASTAAKSRDEAKGTPGSGEALLRGQVKTLLQNVEAMELGGRLASGGGRPPFPAAALGFLKSPSQLLAPTPANTPQIPNLCGIKEDVVLPMAQEHEPEIPHQEVEVPLVPLVPLLDSQITRALFFDSPSKSDASDASTVTTEKSPEDDNSSAWSIQVNACSTTQEDEEEEAEEEEDECLDDLCEGLMKMTVEEDKKFAGKHTRFVYNSDDEIEGEEEVSGGVSPGMLVLRGVPAPEGKHLRFQDEDDD